MADQMTNENSTAQAPDTGSSKQATPKSFKNFFRRKKKSSRTREHFNSVDEPPDYQPRYHGGHYHTVSGTSSLGHVMHDQFSRRHLRRAHAGPSYVRSRTASVSEEEDDDVTYRPDVTSSRRQPGYFRWRYRSAPDDVEDDVDRRSSASGIGGLGGSRVRHWIYSFKQRSRSGDTAGAPTGHEATRSRGSKFKVTPARSLSTSTGHDVISPVQFSEMVRNRTNSDPCFEAWLKAKAAVDRRQVRLINIRKNCIILFYYDLIT